MPCLVCPKGKTASLMEYRDNPGGGCYDRRVSGFGFEILAESSVSDEKRDSEDTKGCRARLGKVTTPHGEFDTPAFMPVGTKGTVKGLLPQVVRETGSQVILNNTYHLMLRPGSELVKKMGGVHRFMDWDGVILTDSGGFQVFSLGDINELNDAGVTFKSQIDGAMVRMEAEDSMRIQNDLGADIIMAFDDCPPAKITDIDGQSPAGRHAVSDKEYDTRNRQAVERTVNWLKRSVDAHNNDAQALFGIVQGGTDLAMRSECAERVVEMDLPGYAIGGVAVGEGHEKMMQITRHTAPRLPRDKPRYLMGVGYEKDIVAAVKAGVDMFDCVLPTRNGRNGNAFTGQGQIRLRNAQYKEDARPMEEGCDCLTCRRFSRAYIRHLFMADEMLGPMLVSIHNIRYFQRLMVDIREAIRKDDWSIVGANRPVLDMDA